jgi:hypothetical protein
VGYWTGSGSWPAAMSFRESAPRNGGIMGLGEVHRRAVEVFLLRRESGPWQCRDGRPSFVLKKKGTSTTESGVASKEKKAEKFHG